MHSSALHVWSNPSRHGSLIVRQLPTAQRSSNSHKTDHKRKQPRTAKLEIPHSTNLRNRFAPPCFEDPRLARPDDPSSGSTRPVAWDKDMSVPVAGGRDRGFVEFLEREVNIDRRNCVDVMMLMRK